MADRAWAATALSAVAACRHDPVPGTANQLEAARADALTTLAPDWRLPHGADWTRSRLV